MNHYFTNPIIRYNVGTFLENMHHFVKEVLYKQSTIDLIYVIRFSVYFLAQLFLNRFACINGGYWKEISRDFVVCTMHSKWDCEGHGSGIENEI